MNCLVCGHVMDEALAPDVTHPGCSPTTFAFDEEPGEAFNAELKQRIIEIALRAERSSARSNQVQIGPSEVGNPCDRRLAYRLTGTPHVNTAFDPWPAVVGTAVHAWMEDAVNGWNWAHTDNPEWLPEQTLQIDNGTVLGHSDLYRAKTCTVVDYKTAGPDVMKKVRENGPPPHYVVQAQIYGLGFVQSGRCVERVALAFLPRAGWLRDMFVWSTPYDESVARSALQRVYGLASTALELDVINHPHRFEQFSCHPSDLCGSCPWFNNLLTAEQGASDKGCPATPQET